MATKPSAILSAGEAVVPARRIAEMKQAWEAYLSSPQAFASFGRPLVLERDFSHAPYRALSPYSCPACGAPVRSHEMACSYCTTERPREQFERLDITMIEDETPQYLYISQPVPERR
jgi:hypothetical protein